MARNARIEKFFCFVLMSSLRRCIVTLVEFGWQFSTVFSNVSSNHLAEQMQSHIGCICLTCLYCASSNVSSYRLLLRMQSHIGFIYLPSPQLASVCFQIACMRGWEVTQIVFVQLLSTRASDMFLWITQFMLTLVTFFELHCFELSLCVFLFPNAWIWMSSQSGDGFTFFMLISKRPSPGISKAVLSLAK